MKERIIKIYIIFILAPQKNSFALDSLFIEKKLCIIALRQIGDEHIEKLFS